MLRGRPAHRRGFELLLPPEPQCVSTARAAVRRLLEDAGRTELLDSALLIVSELVTNALLHAGTEITLAGRVDEHGLTVEVRDGSTHLPSRRHYAPTAGTGRGLLMLESVVDDWGVTRHAGGKTVWFRLSRADDLDVTDLAPTPPVTDGVEVEVQAASVPVELRNMPLLLHAAWQEHAEALLREYLLASLDDEGTDSIQMHADATDAIAVLEEHVPRAPVELAGEDLLSHAVEPEVSAPRVEVPVPVESVAHFETLDRAVQAALDMSRDGLVIAPPTQPEVSTFRRWMVRQVLRQAAGDAPEPWSTDAGAEPAPDVPAGFDAAAVTASDQHLVAADPSARILAVSQPAAALLGYDDPAELVGGRLVSIIPERFRQAHLAGMTMYLLVGRRPIIGRSVELPALRRDGSEVRVEMCIQEQPLGEGRVVLVATLDPL